jgi:capsular exopolysaccharide synthesis family protein
MALNSNESPGTSGKLPEPGTCLEQPLQGASTVGKLVPLQPMPVHPALSASPNAWTLLKALRRRWLPAVVLGVLLGGAVATVVWFLAPTPLHTAKNLLYMAANPPKIVFNVGDGSRFDMFLRSQAVLIKSRFVLAKAIEAAGGNKLEMIREQPDPVQWLEKQLRVEISGDSEIVRISLDGENPTDIETLVNAVTKVYLGEFVDKERDRKSERWDQLKQFYTKFEEKIQAKKKTLQDLGREAGAGNKETLILKQQIALQQLAVANSELSGIVSEIRRLRVNINLQIAEQYGKGQVVALSVFPQAFSAFPQGGLPVNLSLAAIINNGFLRVGANPESQDGPLAEEILNKDSLIQKFKEREAGLEKLIKSFKRIQGPKSSPDALKNHQASLDEVRKALADRRKELMPRLFEEIQRRGANDKNAGLHKNLRQMRSLKMLEKMIEEEREEYKKDSKFLNEAAFDIVSLQDEIGRLDSYFKTICREIDAIDVERQAPSRVKELEKAAIYSPSGKSRQLMMAGGAGLGTMALVLLAFSFLEYRRRKINSADEVVHGLGIRLVGTLPDFNRPRIRFLPDGKGPTYESLLTDSVDALRTIMLFSARMEGLRSVLVTSAVSGEGKTSSASHLAASLARAGRKTLLVDCDLRNPSAHRLFNLPRVPGFSELLRGETNLGSALQPTPIAGLTVMAAGQGDSQAIQVLAQQKVSDIFNQLRQQFDFIVIDSSPVLPVPDALLLGQQADAVILSVLRDVSRLPQVYAAYQRLSMVGIRILGAVVNGTREEVYGGSGYPYAIQTNS